MQDKATPNEPQNPPRICTVCGNEILGRKDNVCSPACEWQKKKASRIRRDLPADNRIGPRGPHPPRVERTCQRCGKTFAVPPSTLEHRSTLYCSRACFQPPSEETVEERFWAKVNRSGECWIWTGGVNRNGYGTLGLNGRVVSAHVFSWEMHNGQKVPKGMDVCHNCYPNPDNKACIRPEHLRIATRSEHAQDTLAKEQFVIPRRFAPTEVIEIRRLYAAGVTIRSLAKQRNCTYPTIRQIVRRETYKHIP